MEKAKYESIVPGMKSRGKQVKRVERVHGCCHAIDGTQCCMWQPVCKNNRRYDTLPVYNPAASEWWCDRDASEWCGPAQDGREYCFIEVENK